MQTTLQMSLFDIPAPDAPDAPKTLNCRLDYYTGKEYLPLGNVLLVTMKDSNLSFNGTGMFPGMFQPPTVLRLSLPDGVVSFTKTSQLRQRKNGPVVCAYMPTRGSWRLTVTA